jgi:hypothetical protein
MGFYSVEEVRGNRMGSDDIMRQKMRLPVCLKTYQLLNTGGYCVDSKTCTSASER